MEISELVELIEPSNLPKDRKKDIISTQYIEKVPKLFKLKNVTKMGQLTKYGQSCESIGVNIAEDSVKDTNNDKINIVSVPTNNKHISYANNLVPKIKHL